MRMTVATAVACLLGVGISTAHDAQAAIKKETTIPAQGLGLALKQLASERDIQFVYQSEIVGQRQTSGAVGELTLDEALTKLLKGTGLTYQYIDERAVTIVPMDSRSSTQQSALSSESAGEAGIWQRFRLAQAEQSSSTAGRSAEEASEQRSALEEITVTGSRIEREGFEAPTPTTTLGAQQITLSAPSNIADVVNQLPALAMGPSTRVGNLNLSPSAGLAGFNALNLRNLVPQRTLVLLDGRRVAPSTASGLVNVNTIPQGLVERVEIVTGGASAAYGSDAVAGVVNFILNDHFEGFAGSVQAGTTRYGDGDSRTVTADFGHSFGDRAHLLLSARYSDQDGIDKVSSRDWYNQTQQVDFGAGSTPRYAITSPVNTALAAPGGLILFDPANGPLAGTTFGAGGAPSAFQPGVATADPLFVVGGQTNDISQYLPLLSPVEDRSAFARFTFDATDDLQLFAEASYVGVEVTAATLPQWKFGNLTIRSDNPFLPTSVRNQMTTAGLPSVSFGTWNQDIGRMVLHNEQDAYRGVLGANLRLGGTWTLNSYYQYGRTDALASTRNLTITARYNQAIDAVRDASGNIVCRNPADGCVPLNIIGTGVASRAAIDWVTGTAARDSRFEQHVVATTLQGQPFSSWAGPVSLAVGAEYRKDTIRESSDPRSLTNGWFSGNYKPVNGDMSVKEAFVETVVPLAADLPLAKSLDVNFAARATEYSTSGSVTTWKAGTTWRPVDEVLFRAVRSRDIRAPNFAEFSGGLQQTAQVLDRFNGNRLDNIFGIGGGNPNLVPEAADTVSFGGVYTPQWLEGLNLSVDYYRIDVDKVVVQQAADVQAVMDLCFRGITTACSLIERDGTGHVTTIRISNVNGAALKTSGLDVAASYRWRLGGDSGRLGTLTVRGLYNRVYEYFFDTGVMAKDYNGTLLNAPTGGSASSAFPDTRASLSAIYERDALTVSLTSRFIGSVRLASATTVLTPSDIADNTVSAQTYFDGALNYKMSGFQGSPELYLAVDNIFDKQPPRSGPGGFTGQAQSGTTLGLYDGIGTTFRGGFRVKF